ncbi:MAG: TIR domain-containing protein [Pseudomonadota bacterium]
MQSLTPNGGMTEKSYDAFLCHNSRDKPFVMKLAARLRRRGYSIWLDDERLAVGPDLTEQVDAAISACRVAIVVLGANGTGGFQLEEEIPRIQASSDIKAVPVLAAQALMSDKQYLEQLFPGVFYADFAQSKDVLFPESEMQKLVNGLGEPVARQSSNHVQEDVDGKARTLAQRVARNGLAVMLGSTWRDDQGDNVEPDLDKLAKFLIQSASSNSEVPLEFVPPFEEAARIFELSSSFAALRQTAVSMFVNARTSRGSDRFDYIADILGQMQQLRAGGRNRQSQDVLPLIVCTTNIDNRLEHSLLSQDVQFVRVVVHRGGEEISASAYAGGGLMTDGQSVQARAFDGTTLNQKNVDIPFQTTDQIAQQRMLFIEALQMQGVPEEHYPKLVEVEATIRLSVLLNQRTFDFDLERTPDRGSSPDLYLVKLLGSSGVRNSFGATSNRILSLNALEDRFPNEFAHTLRAVLANSPRVFLGFSPADSLFQQVHHALLSKRRGDNRTLAVFDRYAESNDRRSFLEGIIGQNRIATALDDSMGINVVLANPAVFTDRFIHFYRDEMQVNSFAFEGLE